MMYFEFANSRNAGPHSVVGLLFSFQRPSPATPTRAPSLAPGPTRPGVPKTPAFREGGFYLAALFPSRELSTSFSVGFGGSEVASTSFSSHRIEGRLLPRCPFSVKRTFLLPRSPSDLGDPEETPGTAEVLAYLRPAPACVKNNIDECSPAGRTSLQTLFPRCTTRRPTERAVDSAPGVAERLHPTTQQRRRAWEGGRAAHRGASPRAGRQCAAGAHGQGAPSEPRSARPRRPARALLGGSELHEMTESSERAGPVELPGPAARAGRRHPVSRDAHRMTLPACRAAPSPPARRPREWARRAWNSGFGTSPLPRRARVTARPVDRGQRSRHGATHRPAQARE
jgi:hypothetical protein